MDDGVDARLLLVSHCLLNPYSQVKGRRTPKATARFAVGRAIEAGVGLMQLPCPEFTAEGPNRWAKSYQQFDTEFFRRHCRELVAPVVEQLREYVADGTRLCGVIGVEGSPSCGAYRVGSASGWGGCFDDAADGGRWEAPPAEKVLGRGVFLAAVADALEGEGWAVPVIGVPKDAAPAETLAEFRAAVDLMLGEAGLEALSPEATGDAAADGPADAPSGDPFLDGELRDWA